MWSAWFERVKTQCAAVTSAEAIEIKSAHQIAYVKERLQNSALISANSSSKPVAPIDHDPVGVQSLGDVRRSYGAH